MRVKHQGLSVWRCFVNMTRLYKYNECLLLVCRDGGATNLECILGTRALAVSRFIGLFELRDNYEHTFGDA